jgi:hypothetical protein
MRVAQNTIRTVWEFSVEPAGRAAAFPTDMLRYDACFPRRTEDATEIAVMSDSRVASRERQGRPIVLVSVHGAPTPGRWESFGWRVMDSQTRRVG